MAHWAASGVSGQRRAPSAEQQGGPRLGKGNFDWEIQFVNKLIRFGIAAAFVGMGAGVAHADTASTTGGFKIKSDDGNFEASIGGRIHFDAVLIDPDSEAYNGNNNRGSAAIENNSGTYFRRVFLSLAGKVYGWGYKVETNMAGNASTGANDFQDVFVSHQLGGKEGTIYLGQHKPWRSTEELTSNNATLFMERPVTSANGILGGRDFQQGVFYSWQNKDYFGGAAVYSLHKDGQASTQGMGYNARLIWSPINTDKQVVHVGGSYSSDHADNNGSLTASDRFEGYRLASGANVLTETFANYGAGPAPRVDTYIIEAAGVYGPFFLQSEYSGAKFKQNGAASADVDAWYVQGSWFVTGESKPYAADKSFGNPKPLNSSGAVELKVRYQLMENTSVSAGGTAGKASAANPGACNATGAPTTGAAVGALSKCEVSEIAAGVNYYVNPNVRFMFDFVAPTADLGNLGKDSPYTYAGRVQLAF